MLCGKSGRAVLCNAASHTGRPIFVLHAHLPRSSPIIRAQPRAHFFPIHLGRGALLQTMYIGCCRACKLGAVARHNNRLVPYRNGCQRLRKTVQCSSSKMSAALDIATPCRHAPACMRSSTAATATPPSQRCYVPPTTFPLVPHTQLLLKPGCRAVANTAKLPATPGPRSFMPQHLTAKCRTNPDARYAHRR